MYKGGIGVEPNWLQSLFLGLISGFSEFLPFSAEAHRQLFFRLTGVNSQVDIYRLVCQFASLLALLLACYPRISKLRREWKLYRVPPKQRKRQVDIRLVLELRLFRFGMIPAIISVCFYWFLRGFIPELWLLAALMAVNGFILYLPDRFPQGNKDSRSLTALDAMALGFFSGFSAVTGISGISCAAAYGKLRGGDGSYILEMCLLLAIPVTAVMFLMSGYIVAVGGIAISAALLFKCLLCAVAAFFSAYYGIILMRFLAYRIGFSGFAYYCWSAALFSFILYLML